MRTDDPSYVATGCLYANNTVTCSNSNACTTDTCAAASGVCSNTNVADYTASGGSNFCFTGVCQACLVWDKEALGINGSALHGLAADSTDLLKARK